MDGEWLQLIVNVASFSLPHVLRNIIDFLIVIIGVLILAISAVSQDRGLVWLRVLRSLRVLRVIRLAAEFESIRVVIGAMAKSIPAVGEVLLVALLFYFIFAVLGMNLMADLFFFCADSNSGAIIDSMYVGPSGFLISKDWCDAGSQNITTDVYHQSINVSVPPWQVSTSWGANGVLQRFDNLFQSLWSLFQIATLENWQGIMYQGMNITGPDLQPVYNYSTAMAIYFVVFIIVCSFFVLSLVVGVSIDQFQKLRKITGKSAFLTEKQQEWVLVQKLLASTTPKRRFARPTGYFRNFCFDISMTDPANFLMVGIIILNIITMFLPHYNQGWEWDIALSVCNAVFTGIYVTEVLVKWTALGIPVYFSDPWNIFDFVVALASIAVSQLAIPLTTFSSHFPPQLSGRASFLTSSHPAPPMHYPFCEYSESCASSS